MHHRNTGYKLALWDKVSAKDEGQEAQYQIIQESFLHSADTYWEPIRCQTIVNTDVVTAFVELITCWWRKANKESTGDMGGYSGGTLNREEAH